ncbi:DUF966 domain-containing protein [Cephalotus follicularis]|uniref:DUF966 domain-containing protein n=1 Tax=Cephalotus follicularis TaxID=3775 RepID=A0A1Q3AQP7_CEPFO|nr:DUF966 domain-containing protein [Cephalotus follicularis]
MAVSSSGRGSAATELHISSKWKDTETSPERTKIWSEPNNKNNNNDKKFKKVPVLYYLSRNGHLDHPHFMEVPLSSNHGLYLRDVINRLNVLRGKGMASLYSWSSKRSYKNGFVWHDLTEDDFIYPAHGKEYVLKGSELLDPSLNPKPLDKTSSFRSSKPPTTPKTANDHDHDHDPEFPVITRRRNQSWSSIDINEYTVYKTESTGESTRRLAADAATQTDDKKRRRKQMIKEEEDIVEESNEVKIESGEIHDQNRSTETELSREEISPPPSDSSPETLESLMKADGRLVLCGGNEEDLNRTAGSNFPRGRMKASTVLMQLISCGSISFADCGPTSSVKDQGLPVTGQCKGRLPPRGGGGNQLGTSREIGIFSGVRLEDKEYFSGSVIETKKEDIPSLKRSNSYNADGRTLQLNLAEKEMEGVRTKCIPRKPKALAAKKESGSNSQRGSKRLEVQQ